MEIPDFPIPEEDGCKLPAEAVRLDHAQPVPTLIALAEATLGKGLTWLPLAGDSSTKVFWRISRGNDTWVGVDGSGLEAYRQKENQSFAQIGRHLAACRLPVPVILADLPDQGVFIIEDLGDNRLSEAIREMTPDLKIKTYRQALHVLLKLQIRGTVGFNTEWCSQTNVYDRRMILRYETTYFTDRLINEYLGIPTDTDELIEEFHRLADRAASCGPRVFLHRDFQSHNILIKNDRIRIIDYQGGRLGPAGYDLASLLIDPFAGLCHTEQTSLLEDYIKSAKRLGLIVPDQFRQDYEYLALHRNFQILGAFAWLTKVKKRKGYNSFLPSALAQLKTRIALNEFDAFPLVRELIERLTIPRGE